MSFKQQQKIVATATINTNFGTAFDVEDKYLVSLNPGDTQWRIYKKGSDGSWDSINNFSTSIVDSDAKVSVSGEYFILGGANFATTRGVINILRRTNDNDWVTDSFADADLNTLLTTGDRYGSAVHMTQNFSVTGSEGKDGTGKAFIHKRDVETDNDWTRIQEIGSSNGRGGDLFGCAVAINDDFLFVGASAYNNGTGTVYVFRKDAIEDEWSQVDQLLSSDGQINDRFGANISLDGDILIVGAEFAESSEEVNAGAVYIFKQKGDRWIEIDKLEGVGEDSYEGNHFGHSLYIDGDYIAVGSPDARNRGVVDIFKKGISWNHIRKIISDDITLNDSFGETVSISRRDVFVSAINDDDLASNAGAIYYFEDPIPRMRLAQEFDVGGDYIPTKASLYLRRVGKNDAKYWELDKKKKTVIDATNFSTIDNPEVDNNLIGQNFSIAAQYKMNDRASNTIVEESIGTIDATFVGGNTDERSVEGIKGRALSFPANGTDYINTNQDFESMFQDSCTVNYWLKPNFSDLGGTDIGVFPNTSHRFSVGHSGSGAVSAAYETSNSQVEVTKLNAIVEGGAEWHMISFSLENRENDVLMKLYFDGVLADSDTNVFADMSNYVNSNDVFIGAISLFGSPTSFSSGTIDNIMFFDELLSDDEISCLYNGGEGVEEFPPDINEITFGDVLQGFTGNGYVIGNQIGANASADFGVVNYPIKAKESDEFNLWIRCLSTTSNRFKFELLLEGVVFKTLDEGVADPSVDAEWEWIETRIVIPDTRKHILGIKIKENGGAIDKIYLNTEYDPPTNDGPEHSRSPYLTTHLEVYSAVDNKPSSPISNLGRKVYDYKNTLKEVKKDDWYNFNLNTGVCSAFTDFSDSSYFLVLSTSGGGNDNFIIWDMVNNDEYSALLSAFRF